MPSCGDTWELTRHPLSQSSGTGILGALWDWLALGAMLSLKQVT